MSDDRDALEKSTAELRAVLQKNAPHLRRIAEGKETVHEIEDFVIHVHVEAMTHAVSLPYNEYAGVNLFAAHTLWLQFWRSLAFRNSPVIIGGGILGMIIGEIANLSSSLQWVLIGVGLLLGIGVYMTRHSSINDEA
jgi:hypothetical protein